MALVTYGGGVTEFSGSLAGNTFQRTRAGQIVRTRSTRPSRSTTPMTITQSNTYSLMHQWRTLTEEQQGQWNTFAGIHTRINIFGQQKTLSGCNYFISINSNLLLCGSAVIVNPPTFNAPITIKTLELVAVAGNISANYEMEDSVINTRFIIMSTPPIQGTTLSFRQALRQTEIFTPVLNEDHDFTDAWQTRHSLAMPPSDPANFNVGLLAYTINNVTGLNSPGMIVQTKWAAS